MAEPREPTQNAASRRGLREFDRLMSQGRLEEADAHLLALETETRLPEILDACCGGRHWWWDKAHPLAIYMDERQAPPGSIDVRPNWECAPDIVGDFRAMPFGDKTFRLVLFDPPHIVREELHSLGYIPTKYGVLSPESEQDDLRRGFAECWRVLAPGGTLVFKWGAGSVKRVEPHFPAVPIVGTRSPRGGQTRWFVFYKPLHATEMEAAA